MIVVEKYVLNMPRHFTWVRTLYPFSVKKELVKVSFVEIVLKMWYRITRTYTCLNLLQGPC